MTEEIVMHDDGRKRRRALIVNGEKVSGLAVIGLSIRLLGARISMGGVANVETEEPHRMKGHCRRLLADTLTYMTSEGYDVSMLFGITDFYDRFGYLPVMAEHHTVVATRDAERAAAGCGDYRIRPVREGDWPFIARLHNEANRSRSCAVIREQSQFKGFRRGSHWRQRACGLVVEDLAGQQVGYAAFDDSDARVTVTEVNATDRRAFWNLLREFAGMALKRHCGGMEVHLPGDHPFIAFVRRYGCETHVLCDRMAGGMMRILNQDSLFAKLEGALAGRLANSPLAGRAVALRLETDLGPTDLRLGGAGGGPPVEVSVRLPQDRLMQLVAGYRQAGDLLADDDVAADGPAEDLLRVLFGGRVPYVCHADRF